MTEPLHLTVTEEIPPALAQHLIYLHRQMDAISDRQVALIESLPKTIMESSEAAARRLAKDDAFVEELWRDHWNHFSRHAKDGSARWIGSRLITAIGVFLAGFAGWLIVRGNK